MLLTLPVVLPLLPLKPFLQRHDLSSYQLTCHILRSVLAVVSVLIVSPRFGRPRHSTFPTHVSPNQRIRRGEYLFLKPYPITYMLGRIQNQRPLAVSSRTNAANLAHFPTSTVWAVRASRWLRHSRHSHSIRTWRWFHQAGK
jgi:hypothetical protein